MRAAGWGAALLATAAAAVFSAQSLRKGQVIKQFEVYSVAESLSRDAAGILRTTLPCEGGLRWAHEPPLFASLGGLAIRLAPGFPALLPLAGYGLLALWFLWGMEFKNPGQRLCATLLSAWAPVFLRYSIQFVPDLWAAAAFVSGFACLRRRRLAPAIAFLTLACAFKVLFAAPALALLFWFCLLREGSRRPLAFAAGAALAVAPYLAWSAALALAHSRGESSLSNAFREDTFLGPLTLLAEPRLYARWFTWLFVKGAGLVLAAGAAAASWAALRGRERWPKVHEVDPLAWWFLGSVPYFGIIRQANIVHDYYSIGFALPLILAGARFWAGRHGKWAGAAKALSFALGFYSLASLRPVPLEPGRSRPFFCGQEIFGKFMDDIRSGRLDD